MTKTAASLTTPAAATPATINNLRLFHKFTGIFGLQEFELTPEGFHASFNIWASEHQYVFKYPPLDNYLLQFSLKNAEFQKANPVVFRDLKKIAMTISNASAPDWKFLLLRLNLLDQRGEVFTTLTNDNSLEVSDARSQPITPSMFKNLVKQNFKVFSDLIIAIFTLAEQNHPDPVRVNPKFKVKTTRKV